MSAESGVEGATRGHTDENRPDVDKREQCNIGKLLQREKEGKDMIRQTLCEAIHGVEGVARKWRRHDPLVVGFVQRLIYHRMVQAPVDPVYEEIGEADKEGELQKVVESKRCIGGYIVQIRMPANLGDEERCGENGHDRH